MPELTSILQALARSRSSPAALATLVAVKGSSYRRPGARFLLLADGTHLGSISGGCLEEDLRERAHRVLSTGKAETVVYDTTAENDLAWGIGLGCEGVVTILVEPLRVPTPAWVGTLRANLEQRQATRLRVDYGGANPPGTPVAN